MASIIIAQIFGITFLITGLAIVLNKKSTFLAIDSIINNPGVIWTLGFFCVLLGATIYPFINPATDTLSLVLYIVSILAILKGLVLLWSPGHSMKFYEKLNKNHRMIMISGVLCVILSIYLLMKGF